MSGRVTDAYRVGRGGVRITWADGAVTSHSAGTVVRFPTRRPLKIEGRLYRVGRRGTLAYEAPALEPNH